MSMSSQSCILVAGGLIGQRDQAINAINCLLIAFCDEGIAELGACRLTITAPNSTRDRDYGRARCPRVPMDH